MIIARLTDEQITRMNESLADYVIAPSELSEEEQILEIFIRKDTPMHVKLQTGSNASDLRLHCTFTPFMTEGKYILLVTIWSYDYKPKYTP
jgi:hypothetical protein